jgi:uncharacterized protein (TIGR03083 family)
MYDAIAAVRADRAALLEICRGLTPAQWAAPSGCPGWSVQDLVAHLATEFWAVVDPSQLPDVTGQSLERAGEIEVESRRGQTPEAVLADYEQVSAAGLEVLAGMADIDTPVPLLDVGSYPMSVLPAAYAFDHYIHVRADLFAPRGPLDGPPPPAGEELTGATLDWIEAGLPQQNAEAAARATIEIQVTGTAGRSIIFGTGPVKATVTSDAFAFAHWVTQRGSWAEVGAQASGDQEALAVARALKVV